MTDEQTYEPPNDDAPPAKKKRGRLSRIIFRIATFYIVYCVVVFFAQDYLIFPSYITPEPAGIEKYDRTTTVLTRDIEDGQVVAWYIPVAWASADKPAPLVMYFHGNAEIIDTQDDRIEGHRANGCSVLLCEYRDYGRSDGSASEAALVEDAVYFLDEVLKRPDVDASRIVIHGRSMGGGIAAGVAKQRPPCAMILGSTFTSMTPVWFIPVWRRHLARPLMKPCGWRGGFYRKNAPLGPGDRRFLGRCGVFHFFASGAVRSPPSRVVMSGGRMQPPTAGRASPPARPASTLKRGQIEGDVP